MTFRRYLVAMIKCRLKSFSSDIYTSLGVKKESTKNSSNKRTRDYLHCIGNFYAIVLNIFSKEIISDNTKCRKQILK